MTIKTIAEELCISHATVSRALNNNPVTNAATMRAIKEVADRLGYVPNLSARLATGVGS